VDPSPSARNPLAAESIFASWLARRGASDADTIDALLRAHPEQERDLRELHQRWIVVEPLLRLAGLDVSHVQGFTQRLSAVHGQGVDPKVSLDAPDAKESKATSELVQRIALKRAPGSRYRLEGEIARGGMGAILRVWDEDIRRHLAMKVVLGKGGAGATGDTPPVDERTLARFLEEAQVTGQLDHPGIVPVHELGLDQDGRVYFTMKLVKGRDLRHIFNLVERGEEGWNLTRALSVMLKVCEAMAYAHDKDVIHRDLKPANVMVGKYGEVFVMDWGLARVLGRKDAHDLRLQEAALHRTTFVRTERREARDEQPDSPLMTMGGDVVGTPCYMPPEQARGDIEHLSRRSDVYSVGAMLYQVLTGQMPYVTPGSRLTNRAVMAMVLQGPPAALTSLRKNVPAELVAICEKAMARDAATRYANTLELAEDLRAYLEHRVVAAHETGSWAETKKWVERNKPLAASLAAAIVILVAGVIGTSKFAVDAEHEAHRADAKADEAQRMTTAEAAARRDADHNALEATQRANDVLSLSAIQDLQDLVAHADRLWPAHPETIPAYEQWLEDARQMIEGRPADAAHGNKRRVSLAEHQSKLAEIRTHALPQSDQERKKDRESHPRFAELTAKKAEVQWLSRMLGLEPWPSEAEVEAALAKEPLPIAANALNEIAWALVNPDKPAHGDEVRSLLLARRAVIAAPDAEKPGIRDTLAWALFKVGRFDEALNEEKRAAAAVDPTERAAFERYVARMEKEVERWTDETARSDCRARREALAQTVNSLEREVDERRTWDFADAEDRWWHAQLSKLVADLERLQNPMSGLYSDGISEEHGWGVRKRHAFAKTIQDRSVSAPQSAKLWSEAIAAIAKSEKYGGLKLTPQLGLVPIGEDPDSHLWEFAHLQTGEPAHRDKDGTLMLTENMGLVFVLIPGGKFWMGVRRPDCGAHHYV
jgi:serine/threonine protein kinase